MLSEIPFKGPEPSDVDSRAGGIAVSRPRVSICIPTCGRAELLRRCCEALVHTIEKHRLEGQVEICISDNGSQDDTPAVGAALERRSRSVVYRRLDTDRGAPFNIDHVVRLAAGEYIAWCGDDDVMTEDGLTLILESCRLDHDIILFNSWHGEELARRPLPKGSRIAIDTAQELIATLGIFHACFLGNIVMRRCTYVAEFRESFLESEYLQLCVVLAALTRRNTLFVNLPTCIVDTTRREWSWRQPLLTAVDMARVQTELALVPGVSRRLVYRSYWKLVKSLPRAIRWYREGKRSPYGSGRYQRLTLGNVAECYGRSMLFQALTTLLWVGSWAAPLPLLRRL